MLGISTKIFGVLSIVLLCSSLWFYSQYQKELANNEILRSNVVQLEQAVETQKITLDSLKKDQKDLTKSIQDLTSQNSVLLSELTDSISEINSLRITIEEKSLDDPFGASVIAEKMFNDRLEAIGGKKDE